ncbi:MAG: chloride channel protein [Janthinobacterium lividum]
MSASTRSPGVERTPSIGSDLPTAGEKTGPIPVGTTSRLGMLVLVTLLIGVSAGLSGMILAMLLHWVQHWAYGYSLDAIISPETFLEGVTQALPPRRLEAMLVCGLVAGFGWWAVYACGRPLVSIKQAVKSTDSSMPLATVGHALLQIVTVGLGSPLGREVAPREIGALFATWFARLGRLSPADTKIMIACGAGAGLAAVYNVPLGGAVFVLEVLLQTSSLAAAAPAIVTSVMAALIAWSGLGNESQYRLPHLAISAPLVGFAVLFGPLFGYAGEWYARLATAARARAPRDWRLVPYCFLAFAAVGMAAAPLPHLLGNGKGPLQLGFESNLGLSLSAVLLVLKLLATTACLRAGGEGGMLTPALAVGGLLATVLGIGWDMLWPGTAIGAFAIVGATAFLSSSMTMPLTATILMFEFTRVDHDFLIPMLLAVGGAMAMRQWGARLFGS